MNESDKVVRHSFVTTAGETEIVYRSRPFESECFNNNSYEIISWSGTDFHDAFNQWLLLEGLKKGDFVFLRLPADDIVSAQQVSVEGFFFVECSLVPYMLLKRWKRDDYRRYISAMAPVGSDEFSQAEVIAENTFKGLRFNNDPFIGDALSDIRYLRWLQNAFSAGDPLLGLHHKGRLAAFSLLHPLEDGGVSYVLAAVHPDFKGSGMGLMLNASTIAYCQDAGYSYISGGISAANCPILNVNASMGFSFRDPSIVFHFHMQ